MAALLAIKAAAGGGHGDTLASWNGSAGGFCFCSREEVKCGAKRRRVVSLSLPSQGLTGVLSPAVGNLSSLRLPTRLGCLHCLGSRPEQQRLLR